MAQVVVKKGHGSLSPGQPRVGRGQLRILCRRMSGRNRGVECCCPTPTDPQRRPPGKTPVHADPGQPWAWVGVLPGLLPGSPRPEHHLLDGVIGLVGVAQDRVCNCEQAPAVQVDHRFEGVVYPDRSLGDGGGHAVRTRERVFWFTKGAERCLPRYQEGAPGRSGAQPSATATTQAASPGQTLTRQLAPDWHTQT